MAVADFPRDNKPLYENIFDLAAGSASLTRASQEGIFFSNPGLLGTRRRLLPEIFTKTGLSIAQQSFNVVRKLVTQKSLLSNTPVLFDLLKTPIYSSQNIHVGTISPLLALDIFGQTWEHLQFKQFGEVGVPQVTSPSGALAGVSTAASLALGPLSLGISPKFLYQASLYENFGFDDFANPQTFAKNALKKMKPASALVVDGGLLLQIISLQNISLRLGLAGTDLLGSQFLSKQVIWKPAFHGGIGLTFFGLAQALHFSLDMRDVTNQYKAHWTQRVYGGGQWILNRTLALAGGFARGQSTFGLAFHLIALRLEMGKYTYWSGPGTQTQPMEVYGISTGLEL